jgi:hypothetical protein
MAKAKRQRDEDGERVVRHELLHDIAGIGADHDELAMGHVDHAHHPEGDGKTDGGKEIDRRQRQASSAWPANRQPGDVEPFGRCL